MKKILKLLIISGLVIFASGMLSVGVKAAPKDANLTDQTSQIEEEGKVIWDKVKANKVKCPDLSDADFEALGYYFMGRMTGDSYWTVNNMMDQTLGNDGKRQTYIVTGKRMSDCGSTEEFSPRGVGFEPMINKMSQWRTDYDSSCGTWREKGIMNFGSGYQNGWSWIISIVIWIIIICAVLMIIKKFAMGGRHREAIRILEARYARGEIDEREFEERRRDIMARWHWRM